MKVKKGTVALYVVALMLVTAGYWSYISNESKMLETVSVANENTVTQQSDSANETQQTDSRDENLGDATLVSNNDVKDETANTATETIASRENQIEAISEFTGVEHRLEFVKEIDGVKYYNDSIGTSPASTIAGLNAFDENIILLAGGSDKGLDYTEIGEKIAEKVGTLILTGPTAEKIQQATQNALEKLNKHVEIIHCKDLQEAVKTAKEVAKAGDIVLLSPASASFDAFKNFAERGNKFKEYVFELK